MKRTDASTGERRAAGGQAKSGAVFIYFNPFRHPSRMPLQITWDNRTKERGVLIEALKPLAHDVVVRAEDGYRIESRREDRGIVYLDRDLLPCLVHGNVPYRIELEHEGKAVPTETFWAVRLPVEQTSDSDAFRVQLTEQFDQSSILEREVEMVKHYFRLPAGTPQPLPEESQSYRQVFNAATRQEKLIDVERLAGVEDLEHRKERYDLRRRTVVTIDSETTKDIDDAIEIVQVEANRYLLGIHIADVAEFVREGSERDLDAANRGVSHYLADRVLHMLPECLSQDYCSLMPGRDRLTLSVYAEVETTPTGYQIKGVRFAKSVTRSKARLSYNEVEKFLQGSPLKSKDPLQLMLGHANQLAKTMEIHSSYHDISFFGADFKYYQQRDGRIHRKESAKRDADTLIEMFMITANRLVGQKIADMITAASPDCHGIGVYRVQPAPGEKDLLDYLAKLKHARLVPQSLDYAGLQARAEQLLGKDTQLCANLSEAEKDYFIRSQIYRLIAAQRTADSPAAQLKLGVLNRFGYKPGGMMAPASLSGRHDKSYHHSLGINRYAWFTSPIRRYPDVVNHRQLKAILSHDRVTSTAVDVSALGRALRNAALAEKALDRRLLCYYLCHQLALANLKTLQVRIASFQWVNQQTFKLECLWQEQHPLSFVFKGGKVYARIDDHGLSCQLDRLTLEVGQEVTIRIADPARDVSAEKGFITITTSQIRAT